jgi:GTP cyclohydrolase II
VNHEAQLFRRIGVTETAAKVNGPSIRTTVRVPLHLADGRSVPSEIISFHGLRDGREHFAVRLGRPAGDMPLVRMHSECVTGDVFGSARCDCGPQLNEALERLSLTGGVLLYLRQEGRGIGLYNKLDAYLLQEGNHDTYAANRAVGRGDDERDYGAAADMLMALGMPRISLLSNNPDKRDQLVSHGIDVARLVPTGVFVGEHNRRYLEAKVVHTRHTIDLEKSTLATA